MLKPQHPQVEPFRFSEFVADEYGKEREIYERFAGEIGQARRVVDLAEQRLDRGQNRFHCPALNLAEMSFPSDIKFLFIQYTNILWRKGEWDSWLKLERGTVGEEGKPGREVFLVTWEAKHQESPDDAFVLQAMVPACPEESTKETNMVIEGQNISHDPFGFVNRGEMLELTGNIIEAFGEETAIKEGE